MTPDKHPEPRRRSPRARAAHINVEHIAQQQFDQIPELAPLRDFWRHWKSLQDWWLFLVPLLAWIGWHTYRKERQKILGEWRKQRAERDTPEE